MCDTWGSAVKASTLDTSGDKQPLRAFKSLSNHAYVHMFQVVLVQDIPGVGNKGTMTTVSTGYYRNYLFPRGLAAPTTEAFLRSAFLGIHAIEVSWMLETLWLLSTEYSSSHTYCYVPSQQVKWMRALSFHCRNLQIAADNQEKAAQAKKAKAGAMKMALQTIGKFNIKKKVGQNNQIFGRWVLS